MTVNTQPYRRGHADRLTGGLHLLDVPTQALFEHALKVRLPWPFLPSFLHEATHFWCLAADLGSALALMEMRSLRALHIEKASEKHIVHDVAATELAYNLLRPLLEGMALFAEFDAYPGDSEVWASPGRWAGSLFLPLEEDHPLELTGPPLIQYTNERIRETLLAYRGSADAARRKTSVLMQPLGDEHGHLSGYWTVKKLWYQASTRTPLLRDRDLFLSFLRHWVFEDWVLIGTLLDEELDAPTMARQISRRFQERLEVLATTDLSPELEAYNRDQGSGLNDAATLLTSLRLVSGQVKEAQARFSSMLGALHEGLKHDETNSNWYFADALTLEHRNAMMRVAVEAVEIEVNEHNRVLVRRLCKGTATGDEHPLSSVYVAGAAPPGADLGVTEGWMAVYFLPNEMRVIPIALRGNQPMLCVAADSDDLEVFKFAATKIVATEELRRQGAVRVRERADELAGVELEMTTTSFAEHVREIYARHALAGSYHSVHLGMQRRGLYDVLGRDGDLLTALVHLSFLPPINAALLPIAASVLDAQGLDLDDTLTRLKEWQQTCAFLAIAADDEGTIWVLI